MITKYGITLLLLALCGIPIDFGSYAMPRTYIKVGNVLLRMSAYHIVQLCGRGNAGKFQK